jgi:hypothetical protein
MAIENGVFDSMKTVTPKSTTPVERPAQKGGPENLPIIFPDTEENRKRIEEGRKAGTIANGGHRPFRDPIDEARGV